MTNNELWIAVYIAAIKFGNPNVIANDKANQALKDQQARFWPDKEPKP